MMSLAMTDAGASLALAIASLVAYGFVRHVAWRTRLSRRAHGVFHRIHGRAD